MRGEWMCRHWGRLIQAPVSTHVIDKGMPTFGLLADVLVAKFMDHLPWYSQEHICERGGTVIARTALAGRGYPAA